MPPHAAQQSEGRSPLGYKEDFSSSHHDSIHHQPRDVANLPPGPPGGPPPDGGLIAWLQVLGGYFLFFNTWGLINAFGVFQTFYKTSLLPTTSNSSIAWIGTLTSFLLCASPITFGPIFDTGSPRLLVFLGSLSVVFGIMMTSLCTQYYQLILAQGICCGVGGGMLFITATSILPSYFSTKRALVMGIAAAGASCGGIIYPLIFTYMQPSVGFGWAVRTIGLIAAMTLLIPCLVIKPRTLPPSSHKSKPPFLKTCAAILFHDRQGSLPFNLMNLATFFGFVGQYIPYFFIEQFAASHDMNLHFWMLIFLNVGSIPGRIIPSLIAGRYFHPLRVLTTTTAAATILAFSWIAIRTSTAGLIVWCLLYGFFSGAFVSLQGAAVASMTKDMATIGTRFGINMFAGALGILIGSPVGGAIFPKSWPGAQLFCACTLGLATVAVAATGWAWERRRSGRAGMKV
jgi:MFS family permease